ncbi:hypothetical protein M0802_003246 [Mischocyttarus mexicanus]|nr:hypothetical protein M0802_003246 [Mischocyttarus mexicanus]
MPLPSAQLLKPHNDENDYTIAGGTTPSALFNGRFYRLNFLASANTTRDESEVGASKVPVINIHPLNLA